MQSPIGITLQAEERIPFSHKYGICLALPMGFNCLPSRLLQPENIDAVQHLVIVLKKANC